MLFQDVKKLNPNVRTILTSAYEVDEDNKFQEYTKEGIIDFFLSKPVTISRLCQKVSDMVYNQERLLGWALIDEFLDSVLVNWIQIFIYLPNLK